MPQPRKTSGRRAPSAKMPAPADAPATPKRASKASGAKPAQAQSVLPEPAAERSATGPVNPDSMSAEVIEFITAVDEYKRKRGRPFPSWSEILEIVVQLGYRKAS
jgi:hypothetical protein